MSFDPGLERGEVIDNNELMDIFKVSNSGGMRRSHETNSLVLVSDHTRGVYDDKWKGEILHYTGMGREGDQTLDFMQNKTLSESDSMDINLFLFEVYNRGEYTYKGRVELAGEPYKEQQKDIHRDMRDVWIFPLKIVNSNDPTSNINIVVMNISPKNIQNCIRHTIHGVKMNTGAVSDTEQLERGDICIIRRTSGGGRYEYGVVGLWYYYEKEDIEGESEDLWEPPTGWKYKIYMKPLVKEFNTLFQEDFSKDVPDQLRHKESTKVEGLLQTDIQGAVRKGFNDPELPKRYLKAIIEEKKEECDIYTPWEGPDGEKREINVYSFLNSLVDSDGPSIPLTNSKEEKKRQHYQIKTQDVREFLRRIEKKNFHVKKDVIYRLFTAIKSKKDIILTGPPGCGKTTLAKELADYFTGKITNGKILTTATSDWSTFETIGGYILKSNNELKFKRGIFLDAIENNKWLIIDEINRADIDKALGELHTVLSGQQVTLPFEEDEKKIRIIPPNISKTEKDREGEFKDYKIDPAWKIIGTMNSYDKSFLYNLSYALMRRFSFIDMSIPETEDYEKFLDGELKDRDMKDKYKKLIHETIMKTIEKISLDLKIRDIGPAIMEDTITYIATRYNLDLEEPTEEEIDNEGLILKYLGEAYILNLLPQFEGLSEQNLEDLEDIFEEIFQGNTIKDELIQKLEELRTI